ncbi:MAG: hypothetical protein RBJ76_03230 [Stenomitos frigidus ULC029]
MKPSNLNLPETLTEFMLGAGLGAVLSLGLLGAAQIGAFGDAGRSERFVAIWATRTLPIVTIVAGLGGVFVPAIYSREKSVLSLILRLKGQDPALGLALEQFYYQGQDTNAVGSMGRNNQSETYLSNEFFLQAPPPQSTAPSNPTLQSYAATVANESSPGALQAANAAHAQNSNRVQDSPNSELFSNPYNPLA